MKCCKRRRPPCRGGCGGLMSFWLPPSAPWSLDPGLRRENDERDRRQIRAPSFPPRKRGPRSRGGAAATEWTSAQWAFGRHGVRIPEKDAALRAAEAVVV